MNKNNIFKFFVSIIVCELAGIIGSFYTFDAIPNWYNYLVKSPLNPPSWGFGPVWTILYILMAISLFLVWKQGVSRVEVKKAIYIFSFQLLLNTLWSILFFGLHSPILALIEIVFMWLSILWTMIAFYKISKLATWLLLPYILWVSFASYLNFSVWWLN